MNEGIAGLSITEVASDDGISQGERLLHMM
jgi:hypothetical protein